MQNRILLGLDVGGTNIKAVVLQYPEKILLQTQYPSRANENPEAVREAIAEGLKKILAENSSICAIGIGCAGSVDHKKGIVRNSPNFAGWKNVPLREWVQIDSGLNTSIDNDANCAVLAEWKLGAARNTENVILLTLGTGIGGGIVSCNRVYRGSTGTAGELGHFSIHADGIDCACGNRGCFERYCSASALQRILPNHSAKEIMERAQEEPFRAVVDKFREELAIGITSISNIFDPDIIVLGGAVSLGVASYISELQRWVSQHAFPAVGAHLKLVMSHFGHQSGAVGAALLAAEPIE